MLRVRVLFFAAYRELAGASEAELVLEPGATVATAVDTVRTRGDLWWLPPRPVVAVNRAYATLATPLADGDEVALLPPVAGG